MTQKEIQSSNVANWASLILSDTFSGRACSLRGNPKSHFVYYCTSLIGDSDILAELSNIPPSGISRYQEHVGFPAGVYNDMPAALPPNEEMNMIYYSAQIQLRKILNRAHKALYSKSESYDG